MTENVEAAKTEETAKAAEPKVNPLEKTIEFSVKTADLEAGVAVELKKLGKKAKLPGFRVGHVPAAKVAEMYGYEANNRVMNRLIEEAYVEAAKASGLKIAGFPKIAGAEGANKPGDAEMKFVATVEVMPEVEAPVLTGLELKRYACEVTDAEVQKTLDIMAHQRATYEVEEGRKAQKDDRVTVNFKGLKDGEAFEGGTANDYKCIVGAGTMLPEFEKAMEGMAAGEKKSFDLTFPENYPAKDLCGKKVTFEIECTQVEKAIIPELNDEFAKKLNLESADKMKAEVRKNLEREVRARLKNRVRAEVMGKLQELATFAVPQAFVETEAQQMAQNMVNDYVARGIIKAADAKKHQLPADLFKPQAEKRVQLTMLVEKIVEANKLAVTADDAKALVTEMAQAYEKPEQMVSEVMGNPRSAQAYMNLALEEKVVDFVLGAAKTTDETVTFDDLMKTAQ